MKMFTVHTYISGLKKTRTTLRLAGALAASLLGGCAWSGWAECQGETVNVRHDANHCGACRYPCPAGIPCQDGQCAYSEDLSVCLTGDGEYAGDALAEISRLARSHDPTDLSQLPQPMGELYNPAMDTWVLRYAADLARDPANCGVCGHVCPPDATCSQGRCVCPAGFAPEAHYYTAPPGASPDYVGERIEPSFLEPGPLFVDEQWWMALQARMRVEWECVQVSP